jgi:hypothetical protein
MSRPASNISFLIPTDNLRWCRLLSFLFFIILALSIRGGAQSVLGDISIHEGARVWIQGSAGLINYQCHAEELSGTGKIVNTSDPQLTVQGQGEINISVTLPVQSLNCGKRAMNKDMYEALKSNAFPNIKYQLLEAALTEEQTDNWMNIRTKGIMEIAGVEDTITIDVKGKVLNGNQFQVKGSKQIHMDTYNIDPPSTMFGLIRANKELTVHFDVTVDLSTISHN